MSILIDDRGGARKRGDDYPTKLQALIPHSELCRLDSGDVAFAGAGVTVGIELKKVSDALSCMFSSRLADVQLPKMAEMYDIRYLVIEDLYRAEPGTGVLQRYKGELGRWGQWYDAHIGQRRMMYSTFELWLHTLTEKGGARLERTHGIEETASLIQALYTWWSRDDHKSFDVFHQHEGDTASLTRPTLMRRILALLPHVGWERSGLLVDKFPTVRAMVEAKEQDWYIERQIAGKSAKDIMEALNGEDHKW